MTARVGGFIWFQMPVEAGDIVPLMYRQGLSMQACVARLQDRYLASSIRTAWKIAHESGQALNRTRTPPVVPPAPRPTFPLYVVKEPEMRGVASHTCLSAQAPAIAEGADARRDIAARRASILHLVDLKRAGHSARFTEYSIPSDHGSALRVSRPLAQISFTGSSSATAAGL